MHKDSRKEQDTTPNSCSSSRTDLDCCINLCVLWAWGWETKSHGGRFMASLHPPTFPSSLPHPSYLPPPPPPPTPPNPALSRFSLFIHHLQFWPTAAVLPPFPLFSGGVHSPAFKVISARCTCRRHPFRKERIVENSPHPFPPPLASLLWFGQISFSSIV